MWVDGGVGLSFFHSLFFMAAFSRLLWHAVVAVAERVTANLVAWLAWCTKAGRPLSLVMRWPPTGREVGSGRKREREREKTKRGRGQSSCRLARHEKTQSWDEALTSQLRHHAPCSYWHHMTAEPWHVFKTPPTLLLHCTTNDPMRLPVTS